MKLTVVMCAGMLALLATPCHAETEFHGVLVPGGYTVIVDTAFVHAAPPAVDTFLTPGWQADSTVTLDSFDFPNISNWPGLVQLAVRIDGLANRQHILGPLPGLWFMFQGLVPPAPEVMFWAVSGVEGQHPGVLPRPALRVYPAVIADRATIEAQVFSSGQARLDMFDAAGNRARTFGSVDRNAGVFSAVWRGEDDSGRRLPGGIYFCRLAAGDAATVRKVLLAR